MKSAPLFCGTGVQNTYEAAWRNASSPLSLSYLGAWFEALKASAHYTQMCRTGLICSEAAQKTYELFGSLEGVTFEDWWIARGAQSFGQGDIELSPGCALHYRAGQEQLSLSFTFTGPACVSSLRVVSGLERARFVCNGLLSKRPVIWPLFVSRVTPAAIFRSLDVARACNTLGRAGRLKLYEVGEKLGLSRAATCCPGEAGISRLDKHAAMGKLVSTERMRGVAVALNAANGVFPSFSRC
jgi:hypothetical protein